MTARMEFFRAAPRQARPPARSAPAGRSQAPSSAPGRGPVAIGTAVAGRCRNDEPLQLTSGGAHFTFALAMGLAIGLSPGLSRGYRPHRAFGACRALPLQLAPPVAEVLQRQPVPLAILTLRQAAKLPGPRSGLRQKARIGARSSKRRGNVALLPTLRCATDHNRIAAGREQTVQEMDGYNGSLIRAENSLIIS
jgi:hypothetical protein